MKKIKIVDSIMGSGKTEYAISLINSRPDDRFIFITPYLNEIKRIKNATKKCNKLYEPKVKDNTSKTADMNRLLKNNRNICTTHSLFSLADNETRKLIKDKNYILIIDEVMDVLSPIQDLNSDDIKFLLDHRAFYKHDNILRLDPEYVGNLGKYEKMRDLFLNGNVFVSESNKPYWIFPTDIYSYFEDVMILTYLWDAQLHKVYFDIFNIEYKKYQILNNELVDYEIDREMEFRNQFRELIHIHTGALNDIGNNDTSLSVSWFKRQDMESIDNISKTIFNWFTNVIPKDYGYRPKSGDKLWTTFKDYEKSLARKGFISNFISLNTKSTNEYSNTRSLAYVCNRYLSPDLIKVLEEQGVDFDVDQFALSEILQWIWRSDIRNGNPIQIFIPSSRMRNLVIDWLTSLTPTI